MAAFHQIDACYDFLRANAGQVITFRQLREHTDWTEDNLRTNISKRVREFLVDTYPPGTPIDDHTYRINRNILNVSKEDFYDLFRQKNRVFSTYNQVQFERVRIYDFYLPLTNENLLHQNLDELFYADTLLRRMQAINLAELVPIYPLEHGETEDQYYARLTALASDLFWGYSISHVSGRYRTGTQILSKTEAAQKQGKAYLVDETTAVVKFIFPHRAGMHDHHDRLDRLFKVLFVKAITEATPDEEEIWLLESIGTTTLDKYMKVA